MILPDGAFGKKIFSKNCCQSPTLFVKIRQSRNARKKSEIKRNKNCYISKQTLKIMKRISTIRVSFTKHSDANVKVAAGHIVQCMTNNPDFPEPLPLVGQITTALEVYRVALANAQSRAVLDIKIKNEARRELTALLRELGLYIISVAKGDEMMMRRTGFPMTKPGTPQTVTNPGIPKLARGSSSGMMEATIKPERKSRSYLFQITDSDPANGIQVTWQSYGSTTNKHVFSGLMRGTQYWVRVVAIGSRGQQVCGPHTSDIAA